MQLFRSALVVCTLALLCSSLALAEETSIDDHLLKDPVIVRVISKGLNIHNLLGNSTHNYEREYQQCIIDWWNQQPSFGSSVQLNEANIPLSSVSLEKGEVDSVWKFTLTYDPLRSSFHPYPEFGNFAAQCGRKIGETACEHRNATEGGPLLLYYVKNEDDPLYRPQRRFLLYFDDVALGCCDGTFAYDRQSCPDCAGRSYLALILGLVLGFVGLVAAVVFITICCRVQKRRRLARGTKDAGHRAPPSNIGPAFTAHTNGHHAPNNGHHEPMIMMRADHMGHNAHTPAPAVVVVKVEDPKKRKEKEEPDYVSTPEGGGKSDRHDKHDKHEKTKDHGDKHHDHHHDKKDKHDDKHRTRH